MLSKKCNLIIIALLCLTSIAFATDTVKAKRARAAKQATAYDVSVPKPTLAGIRYGGHERHVIDFWRAESNSPTPLVFVIHGGGWYGGSKERVQRFADVQQLLDAGISVAAINYRLMRHVGDVTPPVKVPLHDAARALQFVRSKAGEWNIDKKRIGAAGGSAGACSSLWLAYHDDLADPESKDPVARESSRLWCVAVKGPQTTLDPKQMKEWTPNSKYGGHAFGKKNFAQFLSERESILEWIAEYSPYALVSSDDPSVYTLFNNPPAIGKVQKDPTHTANFGVKLKERCGAVGIGCEVVYPGAANIKHKTPTDYLIASLKGSDGASTKKKPAPIDAETVKKWSAPYRNWHYYPDHVIAPKPNIKGYENVIKTDVPTVFQVPGDKKWYMTFIGFDGKGYQSFIAESDDLVNWSNMRLAMGYGPKDSFDYGGVVLGAYLYEDYDIKAMRTLKKKDGKFFSLYGAYPRQGGYELLPGYEGVASSVDGIAWERAKDEPILSVHQKDCREWEKSCIYQPWLVEHKGKYYNFYNAAGGHIEQMGLALSDDILNWKRYGRNPVIPNGPKGSYNEKFSSDGKVFWDGDHWVNFFFGVGKGGAHVMAAYSLNLYHWTVDPEPLYKCGGNPSGLDKQYAHKISLVWNRANETFYMYYNAVGNKGRGIGLITSKPLTNGKSDF